MGRPTTAFQLRVEAQLRHKTQRLASSSAQVTVLIGWMYIRWCDVSWQGSPVTLLQRVESGDICGSKDQKSWQEH